MNALQKINKRAKQLQKKHPGKKYRTLQKQAGKEFKAGKLKTRKKKVGAAKKKAVRKRTVKKSVRKVVRRAVKTVPKKKRVYRAKRTKVKAYTATRYKRVSGKGKSIMPLLLLGAVGVGAYLLLKRPTVQASQYGYMPTNNTVRNDSANSILTWATAAGLTATAIAKLINAINSSSDAQVVQAASSPDQFAQSMLAD